MNLTTIRPFGLATGLLVLTTLAACSSSKKDDPTPNPAGMSWTVDGTAVSTTTLQSQKGSTTISVAGTEIGNNTLFLALEIPNAVGTYPFGPTSAAAATYSTNTGSTPAAYYAGATGSGTVTGAGTILVTALTTNNITGTFTFTGINANTGASKSISSGTFNVGL